MTCRCGYKMSLTASMCSCSVPDKMSFTTSMYFSVPDKMSITTSMCAASPPPTHMFIPGKNNKLVLYTFYCQLLLLLLGDVESNPCTVNRTCPICNTLVNIKKMFVPVVI